MTDSHDARNRVTRFFIFFGLFLVVPIIGTILHEVGHYIAAIVQGYEAEIYYAFCSSTISPSLDPAQYFIFIVGGPTATWIQSLIPFFLLLILYPKERRESFDGKYPASFMFLMAFASFAGRFVFNAGGYILQGSPNMDEVKMANYLGLPEAVFVYLFGVIGIAVLLGLIYIIPKRDRITVTLSCILGSVSGYLLWYEFLGPLIMPVT